ncbi:hypothetical protein D3C79_123250 [compost metagenome]
MGADDATDARRGIAETVGNAGVDGIALTGGQAVSLTVDGQHNLAFQQGTDLLALVLDFLSGGGAGLVGFQHHCQIAGWVAVVYQLHRDTLTADFDQVFGLDHHFGFIGGLWLGKECRQRQSIDLQQLLQRTDGRTDLVLFDGADCAVG